MARGKIVDLFCGTKLVIGGGKLTKEKGVFHVQGEFSRLTMYNINLSSDLYFNVEYYVPTLRFKKGIKFRWRKKYKRKNIGTVEGIFLTKDNDLNVTLSIYTSL